MSHPLTANLVMQKARADRPSMVRRLNVSGAQVNDIAVLEQFKHLEVCSLSANDVSDLAPLSHCDGLRELYLRKNDICDLFQVLHLRRLRDLQILTLSENPVSAHDCYRRYVIAVLPHLHKLDDIEVTHEERAAAAHEFPDVTVCDVPMPLPTKREVLESRSVHGSPNQRPARATSGSFDPPASARGRPAAPMGVRSNVTPPAQETPTPRDDSFSDFPGDDSGADAPLPAQRTSANNYDDRPVGSNRLNAPRQRAQHNAAAAGHRDPANDSSNDAVVAPPRHHHQADRAAARQAPQVAASRPVQQQRSSVLNAPHLGIREENVVRAINLLLSELSPAGLDAVRRQLDICC